MKSERQVSFAGGELAPSLWGRTDLKRYPIGARTIKNFIVTPHGVLVNRPGTQHVDRITGGDVVNSKGRLVSFIFDQITSSILVFVDKQLQIWNTLATQPRYKFQSGSFLLTPYAEDDIPGLSFSQVGNIVTITSPVHAPRELIRKGLFNWSLSEISFDIPDFHDQKFSDIEIIADVSDTNTSTLVAVDRTPKILVDAGPIRGGLGEIQYIPPETQGAAQEIRVKRLSGDVSHPPRKWEYAVTHVIQKSDGTVYESKPFLLKKYINYMDDNTVDFDFQERQPNLSRVHEIDFPQGWAAGIANHIPVSLFYGREQFIPPDFAVYPDWELRVFVGSEEGTLMTGAAGAQIFDKLLETRVYRGRDGIFGFLGITKTTRFTDSGAEPLFSDPPPEGRNPFLVKNSSGQDVKENPKVSVVFEGRRYFAGTDGRPSLVIGSAVSQWSNFDNALLPDDSDALELTLAGVRNEIIRAIVPMRSLIVFTSSSEWLLAGSGQNELLTPNSISARQISFNGSAAISPEAVNDSIFYLQAAGVIPKLMTADRNGQMRSSDISLLSRHLFDGFTVVDWAFSGNPHSVLWVVRSDGKLLSLTYVPEQEMLAWSQHDVGGVVESVAVKPEGNEDGVYLFVGRDDRKYLERFSYRYGTDSRQSIFLDQSKTYEGLVENQLGFTPKSQLSVSSKSVFASTGAIGEDLQVTMPGLLGAGLAGKFITIDTPSSGPLILFLVTETTANVYTAQIYNIPAPDEVFGTDSNEWRICSTSVSRLFHLEGQTITAVADGIVYENLLVNAGSVSIGENNWAGVIHAGVPYVSEFESLDAVSDRGKQKIVKEVIIELEQTRGGEIGPELSADMVKVSNRQVSDGYLALDARRHEERIILEDKWQASGRVAFRQSDPMPVTLLGITRNFENGD